MSRTATQGQQSLDEGVRTNAEPATSAIDGEETGEQTSTDTDRIEARRERSRSHYRGQLRWLGYEVMSEPKAGAYGPEEE